MGNFLSCRVTVKSEINGLDDNSREKSTRVTAENLVFSLVLSAMVQVHISNLDGYIYISRFFYTRV
jgi:hypothetical protein